MFRILDELLFVYATRSFRNIVGNRQARSTQLFGIPIEPTPVEAFSNSMELHCEIHRLLPNFEVLKTPMWATLLHGSRFVSARVFGLPSHVCDNHS